MSNRPLYILSFEPESEIEIPNFFREDNEIVSLLRDPPYLRYSGWNTLTLDNPRIKDGNSWEVMNGDRKRFRIYQDGSFVGIVYADSEFLGWGQNDASFQGNPRLNNLALVEYTYEFANTYQNILKKLPTTSSISFTVGLKNIADTAYKRLIIDEHPNESLFKNISIGTEISLDFSSNPTSIQTPNNEFDSTYIASQMLLKIYSKAGIPENKIPYTKEVDGKIIVNIEAIKGTK